MRYIYQNVVQDGRGNFVASATVTVSLAGGATKASIYAALTGGTVDADGIITTGTDGTFAFYVDEDDYPHSQQFRIVWSKSGFTSETWDYIQIFPNPRVVMEVMPEDYGAVGDGTTDDSAAFVLALATGSSITIPNESTYFMGTTGLTISNTIVFKGQGLGTVLLWADAHAGAGITVDANNVHLEGFKVVKPRRNSAQPGAAVNGILLDANETTARNVWVTFSGSGTYWGWYDAWKADTGEWSQRLFQCLGHGDNSGFYGDRSNYIVLDQSVFSSRVTTGASVDIVGGDGHSVTACDVEGAVAYSIRFSQGDADASGNCSANIAGNYLEGATVADVYLLGYNNAARAIKGVSVTGNLMNGGSACERGVRLANTDGISIQGNRIIDMTSEGVLLETSNVAFDYSGNYDNNSPRINFSGTWSGTYSYKVIDNSDNASSGTGNDVLATTTLPAALLSIAGGLKIKAAGTITGANDTKVIQLDFGGAVVTAISAAAGDETDWEVESVIYNTTNATQRIKWRGLESDGTTLSGYDTGAIDTTGTVVLRMLGECAHTDDTITQTMWLVERILD